MAKPAKPVAEAESERLYRDHLLSRYIRVVGRIGDNIIIEPRPGHFRSERYSVDSALRRSAQMIVGPIPKPPKPK